MGPSAERERAAASDIRADLEGRLIRKGHALIAIIKIDAAMGVSLVRAFVTSLNGDFCAGLKVPFKTERRSDNAGAARLEAMGRLLVCHARDSKLDPRDFMGS